MSRPIAVYAYNRPDYLKQVLESLKPQVKDAEVFLFQDGPRIMTDDKLKVKESVSVFQEYFPDQTVLESECNLGVAFNQKRARNFMLDRHESAIFIEDDIFINEYYIEQLNLLMDKFQDEKDVAVISCFGESNRHPDIFPRMNHLTKYDDWNKCQERNKHKFMQAEHLWAYGLTRHAWHTIRPVMEGYYAMLPDDYRGRPHQQILQYIDQYDIDPNKTVTSQDSVTCAFLMLHDFMKVSTFTMNAKYIGVWGEHSNADHYAQNWKDIQPYNQWVSEFTWDSEIKKSIKNYCKSRYLKGEFND
tara:strand:- start:1 stop:906 length:906 start_codon:yes stop_codon:yes gene_type:complete